MTEKPFATAIAILLLLPALFLAGCNKSTNPTASSTTPAATIAPGSPMSGKISAGGQQIRAARVNGARMAALRNGAQLKKALNHH